MMRSYTVKKIQGKPDWSTIPIMPIDTVLWTEFTDVTAQAQVCWDEEALYVRQEVVEPHIRKEETGLLASVCLDSCLEFFIRPTGRLEYFNIEMNPNRALYLGYGTTTVGLIRLLVPNVEKLLDSKVEFTETGWVLTYRVPFAFIDRFFPDFVAKEGVKLYANAYKCGDNTKYPHYISWNPIESETPNFHLPKCFGELILGGK